MSKFVRLDMLCSYEEYRHATEEQRLDVRHQWQEHWKRMGDDGGDGLVPDTDTWREVQSDYDDYFDEQGGWD